MAKFSQSHFSLHIYGDAQAFTLSQDASNQHLPQWRRHSKDDLSQYQSLGTNAIVSASLKSVDML